MALSEDLSAQVKIILRDHWEATAGRVVPAPADVGLGNKAVEFESATVLYADLDGSTTMVDKLSWQFSAEVYKVFLHCAAKIIKDQGGVITAYDGDRVMAVFIGERKNSRATLCALKIHGAVVNILRPAIAAQYPTSDFLLKHVVGVDTSSIRAARTGVRGDNDLVWVGRAANYAAKLTTLSSDTPTWITGEVFDALAPDVKEYDGKAVWKEMVWNAMNKHRIFCSSWRWGV